MKLKTRLEKIERKIEPGKEIKIWVTKEGDPPLPPEVEKEITHRIVVSKD